MVKRCSKCREEKSPEAFGKLTSSPDGLRHHCRACRSAEHQANPEPARARARKHFEENRERSRAQRKAQYAADPEAAKERARTWYRENRDRHYATMRRWREENRDRKIEMEQNRRARAGGYWIEDIDRLEVLRRRDGKCGICGEPVDPLRFDVDHIVPTSRGGLHSYANVQPAHPPCNQGKRNRLMHEYRRARQAASRTST